MEKEEQIKQIKSFLEEVIVQEIGKLQQIDLSYMQFVIMGQAIEVLGSFLDNKPMKAKGQSSRRFSMGVDRLLGGRYRLLNNNYFLYDKLRNQMTHTFIPSGDLLLLDQRDPAGIYTHLHYHGKKLVLVAEVFYEDICEACKRLISYLEAGKVKPKNIAFEYEGEKDYIGRSGECCSSFGAGLVKSGA